MALCRRPVWVGGEGKMGKYGEGDVQATFGLPIRGTVPTLWAPLV